MAREKFASRIGFILMTAGCAIGLGNVWRFPFITGKFGGAVFVLIYLLFLLLLGFPLMVAELALGRGSQSDLVGAYHKLKNPESRFPWEKFGRVFFAGNVFLMMFYPVITGWLFAYTWKYCSPCVIFPEDTGAAFGSFLGDWPQMLLFLLLGLLLTGIICCRPLQKGVEKSLKYMMTGLFLLLAALIVQAVFLPGFRSGIRYFLAPSLERLCADGIGDVIHAAMTQAFFTLSIGIGSIAICGSYIGKERSLSGEAAVIILLDTMVAIAAGLIIFPVCFSFDISPDAGPSLIFITLPRAFSVIPGGRYQGIAFFLFLSVAALSTQIAVCENLIACCMRSWNMSRKKATALCIFALAFLNLPCLFGFNLLQKFQPFGAGSSVLDLEDFIVSSNLLPLGAAAIAIFCTRKFGWGFDGFLHEANAGSGIRFSKYLRFYMSWILPGGILFLWGYDLVRKFL